VWGQDTEQRASSGHPGERPLQHADEQVASPKQLSDREGRERAIGVEVGAEQDAAGLDSTNAQNVLEEPRRHVQHRDPLAHKRQRGGQALEGFSIARHREMTRPPSRSHSKLGQVHRQPLLQLARAAGSHQGRPWPPTANVNQEAGTIRL
jgi:hypothetical protein